MYFLTNARGYTFVEALFQLMIALLFAHVITYIILWIAHIQKIETIQNDVNWELFVVDVREYVREAKHLTLIQNGQAMQFRVLDQGEERIFIIEKSPTNHVRKRSNLGGNEIMLPYVKKMTISMDSPTLNVQVEMLNGQKRERMFIVSSVEE